ncbi:hypothetical protein E2986_13910 [Frieseomelitta varia]|uniref:Rhomboid protein n=1 Tax=Frieseomelitta varia TaxID=561572 RepID=A0A833RVR6_9HYME|nr:hypothetical protein E2986_13910 [Frieseomelitta varia]
MTTDSRSLPGRRGNVAQVAGLRPSSEGAGLEVRLVHVATLERASPCVERGHPAGARHSARGDSPSPNFCCFQCHGELRYAGWRLGAVLLLASADVASLPIPALLGCGRVGWAAHVAGALAGPLLGLAVFPNQSKKDARGRRFVRFVRLLSAISVMLLVVGAILGNIYLIALPQLRKPS